MVTVRIQTVRFGDEPAPVERMVASVSAAVRHVRKHRGDVEAMLLLGDAGGEAGPGDTLDRPAVGALEATAERGGLAFAYVPFGANLGHGAGQNRLAAEPPRTAGPDDVVVFVNPDVVLAPSCLTGLLAALASRDPTVGIAEARQLPLEHPKPFDPLTGATPWASGCAMAVRAALLAEVGGFEPAFFLHGDDVDLSWRVRMLGHLVRHAPGASVFHDKRPGPDGSPVPGPVEQHHSLLAKLLLAHRAEREDVIAEWLEWAAAHGFPSHRAGAAEFVERGQSGTLPAPYRASLGVSAETVAGVAEFVGSEYAAHRF